MAQRSRKPPSRTRIIVALSIAGILGSGILYMAWKDMNKPIPEFDQLRAMSSAGLRYQVSSEKGNSSIEFWDSGGLRYQTPYISKVKADVIVSQMKRRELTFYYGEWDTSLNSNNIFSIYHIEDGRRILLDYQDLAARKKKEQAGALPVILMTILVTGIAVFIGLKRGLKMRKAMEDA